MDRSQFEALISGDGPVAGPSRSVPVDRPQLEGNTSAQLDAILKRIDIIDKQQSQIINMLKVINNGKGDDADIDEMSIPLDCDEDCQKLSNDLKDKHKRKTLVGICTEFSHVCHFARMLVCFSD